MTELAEQLVPLVTVALTVGPALGRIGPQVAELLRQSNASRKLEIIISVDERWPENVELTRAQFSDNPEVQIVVAHRPGIAAGRNAAIAASSGDGILTCDTDDLIADGWLDAGIVALETCDVSCGTFRLGPSPDSVVPPLPLIYPYGYIPYGLTANLAFRRSAFDGLGGFDEGLPHNEDVDFTWRAQEQGYAFADRSGLVIKFPRPSASARFAQHYLYGRSDPALYLRHRKAGMPRELSTALRSWGWIVLNCWRVINDVSRRTWCGVVGMRLGRVRGSITHRVLYL